MLNYLTFKAIFQSQFYTKRSIKKNNTTHKGYKQITTIKVDTFKCDYLGNIKTADDLSGKLLKN